MDGEIAVLGGYMLSVYKLGEGGVQPLCNSC